LTATLDAYRRRDVEQTAEAAGMARGGDLFDAGHELGDLLADDGTVDAEKVAAAAAVVLGERPHWAKARQRPRPDDAQGQGQPVQAGGWQSVLRREGLGRTAGRRGRVRSGAVSGTLRFIDSRWAEEKTPFDPV
jgi:hypothetical protein